MNSWMLIETRTGNWDTWHSDEELPIGAKVLKRNLTFREATREYEALIWALWVVNGY